MKLRILNQKAGHDPIGEEINKLLIRQRQPYTHVKFLMAFVNKGGLRYIKTDLERYYNRGGVLEFIVGIDNGITTHDALSYLKKRFPEASLFVFHDNSGRKVFHHKIVILENEGSLVCIVGSANLTLGGMFSNYESALVAEFDKTGDSPQVAEVMRTWDAYRNPQKPFRPSNLQVLTDSWLKEHAGEMIQAKRSQKKISTFHRYSGFPSTVLPRPKLAIWQSKRRSRKSRRAADTLSSGKGNCLFVQVLKETGADGAQVQIPTEALSTFFKGSLKRTIPLRLQFRRSGFRDGYIHHFDNNTHRISVKELVEVKRPSMLVFERLPHYQNSFHCSIRTAKNYKAALRFCDKQTRSGAKMWGISS